MDELAVALKIDPLELRLRCYSDRDQNRRPPLQQQEFARMLPTGRGSIWLEKRSAEPGSMRDGSDLVGWGMATGVWEALQVPITVRAVLTVNGHAEISCATSDIGTGTTTIMAQVAADMLGLPIERINIKLGNSNPPAIARGGRIMDRSLGIQWHRDHVRRGPG